MDLPKPIDFEDLGDDYVESVEQFQFSDRGSILFVAMDEYILIYMTKMTAKTMNIIININLVFYRIKDIEVCVSYAHCLLPTNCLTKNPHLFISDNVPHRASCYLVLTIFIKCPSLVSEKVIIINVEY